MHKHLNFSLLIICLFALAACGSSRPVDTGAGAAPIESGTADTGGIQDPTAGSGEFIEPGARPDLLDQRVIYFDFDKSDIRAEFADVLRAHARYLAGNPGVFVRLEGHADERGSREYNIGLGERRAQAVRRVLLLQGSTANQISTVSYGEERPAVLGSNEEAWARNRRVEIVY